MNKHYVAGFFDADGYITAVKQAKNEEPTIQVGFTNTVRMILEKIQETIYHEVGIKGHISKKQPRKDNHSISYDLKYDGLNNALKLRDYMPIVHPKKVGRFSLVEDIKSVTPRNGKYTEAQKTIRNRLVSQLMDIK